MKAQNMTNIIIFYAPKRNLTRDDGSRYLCRWNSRSFPLMKLKFCRFMFISTFSSPFPWLSFVFVPSFKLLSLVRFFEKTLNEFLLPLSSDDRRIIEKCFLRLCPPRPGPRNESKANSMREEFRSCRPVFPDCVLLSPYIKNSIEKRFLCENLRPNDSESGFNFAVTPARQSL